MKDHTEEYFKDIDDMFKERKEEKEREKILKQRKENTTMNRIPRKTNDIKNNETMQQYYQKMKENSVKKTSVKYEPKKKKVNTKIIALALAAIIPITLFTHKTINDNKQQDQIDSYVMELLVPESEYDTNIISYFTKIRWGKQNADGTHQNYYDFADLAYRSVNSDFSDCELIIYNVYKNITVNLEYNMDIFIKELAYYSYHVKDTNPEWNNQFGNIRNFNDYLIKIDCVDKEGKPSLKEFEKKGEQLYQEKYKEIKNIGGKTK